MNMLRSAALLSPIAHLSQIMSQPTKLAADLFIANDVYWLGLHEFSPNENVASKFLEGICRSLKLNCSDLMTVFTGPNCCINSSRINIFLNNEPQPSSTKNLIHLSQMIRTGKIAKYDYGNEEQNIQHYGEASPPIYDMASIPNGFPLFLSYGGQDMLSDVNDVKLLLTDLKDHHKNKLVVLFIENYAHADFVMGVNANQIVYDPIMAFFNDN
ncbi:hypothetical protein AHAS_Ahas14G0012000 [Arachis hypogaea]